MADIDDGPEWTNLSGKVGYGAIGTRDVLLIVSEDDLSHPDVVPRRSAIELNPAAQREATEPGHSQGPTDR